MPSWCWKTPRFRRARTNLLNKFSLGSALYPFCSSIFARAREKSISLALEQIKERVIRFHVFSSEVNISKMIQWLLPVPLMSTTRSLIHWMRTWDRIPRCDPFAWKTIGKCNNRSSNDPFDQRRWKSHPCNSASMRTSYAAPAARKNHSTFHIEPKNSSYPSSSSEKTADRLHQRSNRSADSCRQTICRSYHIVSSPRPWSHNGNHLLVGRIRHSSDTIELSFGIDRAIAPLWTKIEGTWNEGRWMYLSRTLASVTVTGFTPQGQLMSEFGERRKSYWQHTFGSGPHVCGTS